MEGERAARYLARVEVSYGPYALLFHGLRSLILICFYQQPQILELLEVDWQGRADALVVRRGELLGPLSDGGYGVAGGFSFEAVIARAEHHALPAPVAGQ